MRRPYLIASDPPLHLSTGNFKYQMTKNRVIFVYNLGWTDLDSFGSEIETRNLHQLAKQGIMFTDFQVSVSNHRWRDIIDKPEY